jgi:hypothetical protein
MANGNPLIPQAPLLACEGMRTLMSRNYPNAFRVAFIWTAGHSARRSLGEGGNRPSLWTQMQACFGREFLIELWRDPRYG